MKLKSAPPKVSVIMPCFNAARYLASSITSVLQNTAEELELIIIDDGSTDESLRIQRDFAESDTRIRLLASPQRQGPGLARQSGLSVARGKYVAFADADDIWASGKLDSQLLRLESGEVDMIATAAYYLDARDVCLGSFFFPESVTHKSLLKHCHIVNSSVVIRRSLFDSVSYSNDWLSSDYATWLRLTRIHGTNIEILPETLTGVRVHGESHSATGRWRKVKGHWCTIRSEGQSFIRAAAYLCSHITYSSHKQVSFYWRAFWQRL